MSISRAIIARLRVGFAALLLGVGLAGAAAAQTYTYAITASKPNLGDVSSAASGDTIFDVTSGGVITKVSGSGTRISAGTSVATITITCGNQNACNSATLNVTVTATGSQTGRAGVLSDFDAGGGTATISNKVIGANSTTFTVASIRKNSNKTFNIGLQMPIKATGTTGSAQSSFLITLNASAGNDGSLTGTAIANVVRSLSVTENSALSFGAMVRPSSGSSTITVNATTGIRTLTGSAVGVSSPTPTRANYTVSGEGGRTMSISVPSSFVMSGPSGSNLTITTTNTVPGTPTLSGSTGAGGTLSFSVGGAMTLLSSTPPGAYSGAFTITATYN
jgi:hypothetical protein